MKNNPDIIWLDVAESSNDEARKAIDSLDNLSVVAVRCQTSGRGRQENVWVSAPGENLTFSIVLKSVGLSINARDQFAISQAVSLAVADLLAEHGIEAQIKWPNDIYVGNRKICGILIENAIHGDKIAWSIAGIGLNVNQICFPASLPNPTSMALESEVTPITDQEPISLEALLAEFQQIFISYCNRYLHIAGGLKKLRQLYLSLLWHKDQPQEFIDHRTSQGHTTGTVAGDAIQADAHTSHRFTGTICGISDHGHLLIKIKKGELLEFAFNEISYIL